MQIFIINNFRYGNMDWSYLYNTVSFLTAIIFLSAYLSGFNFRVVVISTILASALALGVKRIL